MSGRRNGRATELGSALGLAWLRREAGEGGERKDHQRSGHKDDCASQRSHLFTTNSLLGGGAAAALEWPRVEEEKTD